MPVDGRALMTEEAMALAMRIFERNPPLDIATIQGLGAQILRIWGSENLCTNANTRGQIALAAPEVNCRAAGLIISRLDLSDECPLLDWTTQVTADGAFTPLPDHQLDIGYSPHLCFWLGQLTSNENFLRVFENVYGCPYTSTSASEISQLEGYDRSQLRNLAISSAGAQQILSGELPPPDVREKAVDSTDNQDMLNTFMAQTEQLLGPERIARLLALHSWKSWH